MSMLQHNLIDFSVEAYHDGALETIGKEDLLGVVRHPVGAQGLA